MENNRLETKDLVHAYGDWIIQELFNGHNPYYINIMFDPLDRRMSTVITQMTDAVYAAKGSFYAKLCSRFDRHPGRKGRNRFLPHAFLFFDLPVQIRQKIGITRRPDQWRRPPYTGSL
jgi:hypothetical protein